MNDLGVLAYIAIFLGASALSLGLTPIALRVAVRKRVFDEPGGHKRHESPVPYLGGLAIAAAFCLAVAVAAMLKPPPSGVGELLLILGCALALGVTGLVDDLRGLSASLRLGLQVALALACAVAGIAVSIFPWEALNLLITVMWIVGITNAVNLLDNMDGLSAGVAGIAALTLFVIAAANGQFAVAALAVALVGCALGFLRHNFHPARIYMGDAGSLFLGFMLAILGIKLRFDGPTQITFMVPILALAVPIFDTTLVVLSRLLHRRSPFLGGRDHVSHRLVLVGIPVPAAVALIYGAAVAFGWAALLMSRLDTGSAVLLMGLVVTATLFFGVLLGRVPVYASSRRRHLMIREVDGHEPPVAV